MTMGRYLLFLIPPAAGAVIGFVTNLIAIRMLFRPLKEIRILKIKLPFTPGILPKQRHRLAQSIGGMVERELLTAEIVRKRLLRDDVRESIKNAISLFTEKLLSKTPGELTEKNISFMASRIPEIAEKIYPSFSRLVMNFLNREEIRIELESRGRIFLSKIILQLNAFQRLFLSAGQYDQTLQDKMPEIIDELIISIEKLLQEYNVKKMMMSAVTNGFLTILSGKEKSIGELINLNKIDKEKFDAFIFSRLMQEADKQTEKILSTINIKTLVAERIDSLDMLRVERIILDVMADQFKWINVFGAILGFLIGAFQSVFAFFIR